MSSRRVKKLEAMIAHFIKGLWAFTQAVFHGLPHGLALEAHPLPIGKTGQGDLGRIADALKKILDGMRGFALGVALLALARVLTDGGKLIAKALLHHARSIARHVVHDP